MWKKIDGYFWPYRINEEAEVEWKDPKTKKWVRLQPFMVRTKQGGSYGHLCVRMKTESGNFKNVYVKSLMVDAFFGGKKKGIVYEFINGSITDCAVYNLRPRESADFFRGMGGGLRKSVEKIDTRGRVIELYSSVSEAAEKNFMSRRAVSDRCLNHIQDPFALMGYSFRYERPRGVDRDMNFITRE